MTSDGHIGNLPDRVEVIRAGGGIAVIVFFFVALDCPFAGCACSATFEDCST